MCFMCVCVCVCELIEDSLYFYASHLQNSQFFHKCSFRNCSFPTTLKQERKYVHEERTQFQIFPFAPENSAKERVWGWVGERKEKAFYFSPNIQILWEIHLYDLLVSSNESIVLSLVYNSSRPLENGHRLYCSSFSMIVHKRYRDAGNAFQYQTM